MKIKQILSRFYVNDMDKAIEFYEKVLNEKCASRFQYPEANLEIARIANILIICGSDETLKAFNNSNATFLVDSVAEFKEFLLNTGATVISDIKEVPTGFNMMVQYSDGNIVEYVEHRK
jgi:predicted enzyme related to lactoylglutathione lyase